MPFNEEEYRKIATVVEQVASRLGYNACGTTIHYTAELEYYNIDCVISISYIDLGVDVEIDVEDWERIPDEEALNEINVAFKQAKEVGLKIVRKITRELLCNTNSN